MVFQDLPNVALVMLCGGEEVKECKSLKKNGQPGKGSTRKETDFRHGISSESHPVLLAIFRTLYEYIQYTGIGYSGIYDTCIWEFRFG